MKKLICLTLAFVMITLTFSLGACGAPNNTDTLPTSDGDARITVIPVGPDAASYISGPDIDSLYRRNQLVIIATYQEHICTFASSQGWPHTVATFNVLEVIKGDYDGDTITALYLGGRLPYTEYLEALSPSRREGLRPYTEEQMATMYVEYHSSEEVTAEFEEGQRYMLFLRYNPTEPYPTSPTYIHNGMPVRYGINWSGYGALEVSDEGLVYSYPLGISDSTHQREWVPVSFWGAGTEMTPEQLEAEHLAAKEAAIAKTPAAIAAAEEKARYEAEMAKYMQKLNEMRALYPYEPNSPTCPTCHELGTPPPPGAIVIP